MKPRKKAQAKLSARTNAWATTIRDISSGKSKLGNPEGAFKKPGSMKV